LFQRVSAKKPLPGPPPDCVWWVTNPSPAAVVWSWACDPPSPCWWGGLAVLRPGRTPSASRCSLGTALLALAACSTPAAWQPLRGASAYARAFASGSWSSSQRGCISPP